MSTVLKIDGLDELREALRHLPKDLGDESGVIVQAHAEEAERQMDANYAQHEWTGKLRRGLSVVGEAQPFGARYIVKNTDQKAWWAENGTQIRKTSTGANRGAMPPIHAFVPVAIRQRRAMVEALKGVVRRAGLLVSDTEIG